MEIRTPRLILRSARPDDLEAMHAVLSDHRATLWWSEPPHETLDESRTWLDAMIANGPDHPDFVVELDGRVIGKAGFWRLPEIGYILHPDVWGQGLASEAVGAAIDHVFGTRDFDSLTADVDPENAASIPAGAAGLRQNRLWRAHLERRRRLEGQRLLCAVAGGSGGQGRRTSSRLNSGPG